MGVTGKKRVAESFEHKRMKQYMFENLHANNNIKKMELEYNVECRGADLYGELIDGRKFAIEFQNSKISVDIDDLRDDFYILIAQSYYIGYLQFFNYLFIENNELEEVLYERTSLFGDDVILISASLYFDT